MKKVIVISISLLLLFIVSGCKKNKESSEPVRISYLNISPQAINGDETAMISLSVSNLNGQTVIVRTLADQGLTNPILSYTTGNPLYIEYTPPKIDVEAGEPDVKIVVIITVIVVDQDGNELDRADGRLHVYYEASAGTARVK